MRYHLDFTSTHHSVGQGLLHSGILRGARDEVLLSVVYDCGTTTGARADREARIAREIENIKSNGVSRLDALYLSHFDEDHVNGVPQLITALRPRTIVIPAVPAAERLLRVLHSRGAAGLDSLSEVTRDIVREPDTALRGLTQDDADIVTLGDTPPISDAPPPGDGPVPNESDPTNPTLPRPVKPSHASQGQGAVMGASKELLWIVKPWVRPEVSKTADAFAKALGYPTPGSLEAALPTLLTGGLANRKRIAQAYKTALAGVRTSDVQNFTSLCLYSGPTPRHPYYVTGFNPGLGWRHAHRQRPTWTYSPMDFRPGWVGTGDATLKPVKSADEFHRAFSAVKSDVGQVTFPHHGSHHNARANLFDGFGPQPTWIASAGTTNSYGHPSPSVLQMVSSRGGRIVIVNEDEASRFTQVTHMNLGY